MMPRWYCDAIPLMLGGDTGVGGPFLRGRLLGLLHGAFANRPAGFAVAFPGDVQKALLSGMLRIFASSREDLDWLATSMAPQPWFRDYYRFAYPCAVPEAFDGEWMRYCRYRIPSLASDRHEGEQRGQLRQRRMAEAGREGLAYFVLRSGGNGQRFSLLVRREPAQMPYSECVPNGYGFSVTTRPFSLPELPWL